MSIRRHANRAALLAVLLLLCVACGTQSPPFTADRTPAPKLPASVNLVPDGYDGRFRTRATVLESPDLGPRLCYAVAESYPPQCSGTPIAGWDWSTVRAESAHGTTWGEYVVTGTYDGETFTLTEPAEPARGLPHAIDDDALVTPCPAPAGGWRPVDPATATQAALEAAAREAEQADGYAGLWIDQRIPADEISEQNANNPKRFVLNIRTTGDVSVMEAAVRAVWGGSLCVSPAVRSAAQLDGIAQALPELPGLISKTSNEQTGQVWLDLVVARTSLQRDLDQRFGAGTVRLFGLLEPID